MAESALKAASEPNPHISLPYLTLSCLAVTYLQRDKTPVRSLPQIVSSSSRYEIDQRRQEQCCVQGTDRGWKQIETPA